MKLNEDKIFRTLVLTFLTAILLFSVGILALLNFALFATPHLLYWRQKVEYRHSPGAVNYRHTVHQAQKQQQKAAYHHKCAVCGRTDTDYPDLQFRYCSKCAGYHCFCQDHIFSHVHFTEE